MPLVPPTPRHPSGVPATHKFFLKERVAFKAIPSACSECKKTDVEHYANNLCMTCYNRAKMKAWRETQKTKKRIKEERKAIKNNTLDKVEEA